MRAVVVLLAALLIVAPLVVAHFRCGNGLLDAGEECDDGSEGGDDGCGLWSTTLITTSTTESDVGVPNTRAGHVMVIPPHGRPIVFRRFADGFIAQVCDDTPCNSWTTRTLDSGFGTTDATVGYPAGGLLPDGRPIVAFQRGWFKNAHSLYTCADQLCTSGTLTPLPTVPLHPEPAHWELLAPPVPADVGGIHLVLPARTRGQGGRPTTLSLFICYDDTCTVQNNQFMVESSGLGITQLYDVFPTVQYDAIAGKFVVAFCRLENGYYGVWTLTLDPLTLAVSTPTKVVGTTGIQQCLSLRSTVDPASGRMVIASGRLDGALASGPSYVVARSSVEVHTCANDGCTSVTTRANVIPSSYGGSKMPLGVHYDDENNLVVEVAVAPFGNSDLQLARCNSSSCRLVRVKTEGRLRPLATAQRPTGQILAVASQAFVPGKLDILMLEEQVECFQQPNFTCVASATSPPASTCTPICECGSAVQTCDAPGLSCAPVCGDGFLAGSETCDSAGPECETPPFSSIAFTNTNSSLPSVTWKGFANADPTPYPLLPYWNTTDIAGFVRVSFDNRWFTYTCNDSACTSASEQIAAAVYRVQSAPGVVLYRNGVNPVVLFTALPLNTTAPQVRSVVAFDVRGQTFSPIYTAPVGKLLSFSAVSTSTGFTVFYSHSGETAVRALACDDWSCSSNTTSTLFANVPASGVLRAMSIGAVRRNDGTAFVCSDRPVDSGASFVLNRGIRCFSCANERCTSSLMTTWFETVEVITSSFNMVVSNQGYPLVLFTHREVMTLMKCENFACTSASFAPVDPRLQWLTTQRPVSSALARTGELMILLERAESARNEWWVAVSADYSTFAFREVAVNKSLGSLLAPSSSASQSSTPLMLFWTSPYCFQSPISCGPSGPSSIQVYQCASQDCLACQRPVPPSVSPTPTPTAAATASRSATALPTPTPVPTTTPVGTPSGSPSPAATVSATSQPTSSVSATTSSSGTASRPLTGTPTRTFTSSSSATPTGQSRTSSTTATPSSTSSGSPSSSRTPSRTPTPSFNCLDWPGNECLIDEHEKNNNVVFHCSLPGRADSSLTVAGLCKAKLLKDGPLCRSQLYGVACAANCHPCGDHPEGAVCQSSCDKVLSLCPEMVARGCFEPDNVIGQLFTTWCRGNNTECRTSVPHASASSVRPCILAIAAIALLGLLFA